MRKLKVAVIGAGSTYTPELVNGFLTRKDTLAVDSFYMMDIDQEKNRIVSGLAGRMIAASGIGAALRLTGSLEEAVEGADYVIGQVRVGRLDARVLDERIPLKYNLLGQETTGVGGYFNGLRTIPVIKNVADTMEKLAPKAWLINFSNPSGIVAQMLSDVSPIRSIGLCNGPVNTIRFVKAFLPEGTKEFDVEYVGLNHLAWLTGILADGKNILPGLWDDERLWKINEKTYGAEFMRAIGGIPSGYLNYYYSREETVKHCQELEKTRGEVCKEIEAELLKLYQDPNLVTKPAELDKRGGAMYSEAAVSLIDAIENDKDEMHIVNVKNQGALPFLSPCDVAEVRCMVGKDGPKPIPIREGYVNAHMVGIIQAVKIYERLAVKAGLTGDYDAGLLALLNHPLVGDYPKAKAVYDEMLAAHAKYLPQFAAARRWESL
ncbi:MAG: 6-phospho-beta-glucosidase [Defluviitaleaceae bacterium]|nr:6-phospho-beta-glucosidase [Defluviitaleaceae bacterium]